jgi:hemolysin activation/secretion protein
VLRYPISRFTRVEGQTRLEYSSRDDFFNQLVTGPERRKGVLASNYLSAVGDNTLWLDTGPIDGMRWALTGGVVSDITHGVFENWIGTGDVRKYVRTSQQSAFAFRTFGYVSQGTRPRAIQVGGSWLLRGYPRFGSNPVSGTHAWVFNSEWRFPITNFVTFGFPFGSIRFPQVQGAFFGDLGQAWYQGNYDSRVLGAAGVGFRMALLPGLVLRLDVGRRYSFAAPRGEPSDFYRQRFVDLFIGYDY